MRVRAAIAVLLSVTLVMPIGWATATDCEFEDATAGYAPDGTPLHTPDVTDVAESEAPLRVFAIQFKQMVDYVRTATSFDHKMRCLIEEYVVPHRGPGVNLVVFNEDIGLATLATGIPGEAAREFSRTTPLTASPDVYDATGVPYAAAVGLGAVAAGYARQLAYYRSKFPDEDPRRAILTAATDTFVRGFMTTFSRIARDYDLYVVASNNQGNFEESTDPVDVATLYQPTTRFQYPPNIYIPSVWKARTSDVWNQALLWGPYGTMTSGISSVQLQWLREQIGLQNGEPYPTETTPGNQYDPRSNLLAVNKKVPLTQIEKDFLALSDGDVLPHNTGPFVIPAIGDAYKFGFAISLPAFEYGGVAIGQTPENRCAADGSTWMHCLDERGVNVVLQPEANPGPWATGADGIGIQALSWGASTLRAVIDPAVHFRYLVCPHMVGNLLDLPFDGQSAIMQRGRTGMGRHYVGSGVAIPGDGVYAAYAGDRAEFLALAPWVMNELSQNTEEPDVTWEQRNRDALYARSQAMRAGSHSSYENAYLETAIYADLPL